MWGAAACGAAWTLDKWGEGPPGTKDCVLRDSGACDKSVLFPEGDNDLVLSRENVLVLRRCVGSRIASSYSQYQKKELRRCTE